jgi:hypothetical protein
MQISNHGIIAPCINGDGTVRGDDLPPWFIRFGAERSSAGKFSQGTFGWLIPFWVGVTGLLVGINQGFKIPIQTRWQGGFGGKFFRGIGLVAGNEDQAGGGAQANPYQTPQPWEFHAVHVKQNRQIVTISFEQLICSVLHAFCASFAQVSFKVMVRLKTSLPSELFLSCANLQSFVWFPFFSQMFPRAVAIHSGLLGIKHFKACHKCR